MDANIITPDNGDDTLYILDSYALIYRSYFAFVNRPIINKDGKNISAIFGFFRTLNQIIKQFEPRFFVAAFDSRVKTFRHELYSEYKATRQKTPEDLHSQIPAIEEILGALGISVIRHDGFEADDIIATLSKECCNKNRPCRILTVDKDLMQLIDCTTEIIRQNKVGEWEVIGEKQVQDEWGVTPKGMLDILSLVGDTADNVPGVKGIGEKTALKLLEEYGDLDSIFEHASEIKGAVGKKLIEGKDSAYFSKKLIALRYDVPINQKLEEFCISVLDKKATARLLLREGAFAVAKQYDASIAKQSSTQENKKGTSENNSDFHNTSENFSNTQNFSDEEIFFTQYKDNPGQYTTITNPDELKKIIDYAIKAKEVAFDWETTDVNIQDAKVVGFSLCVKSGEAVYVPLRLANPSFDDVLFPEEKAKAMLSELFKHKELTVVMHNGKYDYSICKNWGIENFDCKIFDTMIAAWLLSPDRSSYNLETLSAIKLGFKTTAFKDIVPKGETIDQVPIEVTTKYCGEDSDMTFQLAQIYKNELKKRNLENLFFTMEMPLIPILSKMELKGILINPNELNKYSTELKTQLATIEEKIYKLVGHSFNIASPKQLQTVLFEELKLPTAKKTKTGYSTDSSVLEDLANLNPVPKSILRYRTLAKLLSTYVEALPALCDNDNRIHTSFIQTGTATGRLSSRDPNLQNIPVREEEGRRIRNSFVAKNGYQLISADYSQIELVILAHLSKDKNLFQSFIEGTDVHKKTASLIFSVQEKDVTPEMRRVAKTINFGVMYGMSPFRLSKELQIPMSQAKHFIETYFITYNGIQEFIQSVVSKAEQFGYVETIMSRRRYISEINSKNKIEKAAAERIAVNTPIQGSAADIVKMAMIKVQNRLTRENRQTSLLLQVHDELILEAPDNEVSEVRVLVKEEMENTVKLSIPLRVSVESGPRWGDFH